MRSCMRRSRPLRNTKTFPATTPAGRACSTKPRMRNICTDWRGSISRHPPTCGRPARRRGCSALECAMDELAVALKLDPLELRLRCYSDRDQNEDRPYTSKKLRECYRQGAATFGWDKRNAAAALDARRQRTGRLGHGDRCLGRDADGIRHPHRAHRQRPCRGRLRRVRHRHRHLHDHGAGDRRHARSAARQCHGQARRLDAAAGASRRRLVDRGVGRKCHRQDGRGGAQRAVAASQEDAEFRARLRQARRHRARRTARSSARQRRSGPFRSRTP